MDAQRQERARLLTPEELAVVLGTSVEELRRLREKGTD